MKNEYEEIKKLLIDDIKNADDIAARSIAVNTFVSFFWMPHHNDMDSPNECTDSNECSTDDVISQEDIENKVSIMMNALHQLARLGNEPRFGNSIGNCIAIDALRGIGVIADSGNSSVFDQAGL